MGHQYIIGSFRLIVDKDDLKWVTSEENVRSKSPRRRKLSHSLQMQNYALMQRWGLRS